MEEAEKEVVVRTKMLLTPSSLCVHYFVVSSKTNQEIYFRFT